MPKKQEIQKERTAILSALQSNISQRTCMSKLLRYINPVCQAKCRSSSHRPWNSLPQRDSFRTTLYVRYRAVVHDGILKRRKWHRGEGQPRDTTPLERHPIRLASPPQVVFRTITHGSENHEHSRESLYWSLTSSSYIK